MSQKALLADLVTRIGNAGAGVPVTYDPLQAVPPCVLVAAPVLDQRVTNCVWAGNVAVWCIAPPDYDKFGIDRLLDLADLVLVRLKAAQSASQPYDARPGVQLPAVRVLTQVTVTL